VISRLACSLVGQAQAIRILPGSLAHKIFQAEETVEEFRCNYGLNPSYRDRISGRELKISGVDADGEVRIIELPGHRFYIATLFLPQLTSSPDRPHPLIVAYLMAALNQKNLIPVLDA
jgi:CTP synthase (UTP-ammonia lyase)